MAKRKQQASDNTWRRLARGKPSKVDKAHRWLTFNMFLLLVFIAALGGALAAAFSLRLPDSLRLLPELSSAPVETIQLRTNGVIREATVWDLLGRVESTVPLDQLDIFSLKNRLEGLGQVRSAIVEKRYPDSLIIDLHEYEPVARVLTTRNGQRTLLLVSREGVVFQGVDYPNTVLRSLPFLNLAAGTLRLRGNGYADIQGMEVVSELLSVARVHQPRIYANWRIVDLSAFDPSPAPVHSLIKVRTRDQVEVAFRPEAFEEQMRRLDFILSHAASKSVPPLRTIDLSYSDPVVTLVDGGSIPSVPRLRP